MEIHNVLVSLGLSMAFGLVTTIMFILLVLTTFKKVKK